jgi:transcriptional regulator with XRE-family HTH domain
LVIGMNLKKNLGRLLAEKNMKAAKLSRLSGVPQTTLADWLAGGNPRDLRKVKLVAEVFGISVDELCFGEGRSGENPIEKHLDEIMAGTFEVILRRPRR